MSTALTPAKRPDDLDVREENGNGKKQKSESLNSPNQTSKSSPGGVLLRILCPISRIQSIFKEGDAVISQIHQETGARVRIEENIPSCDESVVHITYPDKETETNSEQTKEDQNNESNMVQENDNKDECSEGEKDKKPVHEEDQKSLMTSSVQRAILSIFERMVEAEAEAEPDTEPLADGEDGRKKKPATCSMRLLVLSIQVGSLLGRSGSIIKQMANESGAQIRILPRDKLPTCASAADDLVQITGDVHAARKALQLVSQQLLDNQLGRNESLPANFSGRSSNSSNHPLPKQDRTPSHRPHTGRGAPHVTGDFHESGIPGRMKPFPEITFRLLCNVDAVGCIIGKGGSIIKTLEKETGCEIKVLDTTSESDERIIVITGLVHPNDRISAPQDGVVRVQTRIFRAFPDDKEKTPVARLLVSSNQIGCLLGKGGSVIAEMRKSSGAYIRILGKEQVPKCASEGEEVVQMNGDYDVVKDALLQITSRLQHNFFKDMFPSTDYPPHPSFMDQGPPFPTHMGRRELSPPFHSFQNFDGMANMGGPPPHGGFHPHDERPPFFHHMHRPGLPDRNPWGRQGFMETGMPMGLPDFAAPRGRIGFNGVSNAPIITSTTIEVIVPRSVVPEIYGEDGAHLKQIIEFSDAKIKINDPKPGAKETVITITGTPEQSNAAQSLIQAFVMLEKESKGS